MLKSKFQTFLPVVTKSILLICLCGFEKINLVRGYPGTASRALQIAIINHHN